MDKCTHEYRKHEDDTKTELEGRYYDSCFQSFFGGLIAALRKSAYSLSA